MGFPLLHPHGWKKLHPKITSGSGGMVCPQVPLPDAASLVGFGELSWRAPKVRISCGRMGQNIPDVIPVFMWTFMSLIFQVIFFQLSVIVITVIVGFSGSFRTTSYCFIQLLSLLLLHLSRDSTDLSSNPHDSHADSHAVWLKKEVLYFMTGLIYISQRSVSIFIYSHLSFT